MSNGRRVLVVEDDPLWSLFLCQSLRRVGFIVDDCTSWLSARQRLKRRTHDFLIADLFVNAGLQFGVDSLRWINSHFPVPTLVLTSAFMDIRVEQCRDFACVTDICGKAHLPDLETVLYNFLKRPVRLMPVLDDRRDVFVVYGRNETLRRDMFAFLRTIGLRPLEWEDAVALCQETNPFVGDVIEAGISATSAVVVILSPDDQAQLSAELRDNSNKADKAIRFQPRPNVIFEAGYAMGLDKNKTILLEVGKTNIFTDIAGRHIIRFSGNMQSKNVLISRLRKTGVTLNMSGNDWIDFKFN